MFIHSRLLQNYIHDDFFILYYSIQLARTERIKNSLNPSFTKVIQLDYVFEETQKMKFSVFDIDSKSSSLNDEDFLGSIECTLGEVYCYTNHIIACTI